LSESQKALRTLKDAEVRGVFSVFNGFCGFSDSDKTDTPFAPLGLRQSKYLFIYCHQTDIV